MSLPNNLPKDKDGRLKQVSSYPDGRTKQCFKDECDIQKIMARADKAGTISHLQKYEGVYADYSDVNFQEMENQLAAGNEIFASLPAELRQEFKQSPQAFFRYVNDPANKDELLKKLPGLAAPGRQLNQTVAPSADEQAVETAANEPAASKPKPTAEVATQPPLPATGVSDPPAAPPAA